MRLAWPIAIALLGCGNDRSEPPPPDLSCEGTPDPHCAHPIDRVLVPRLRALGLAPRDASPEEVCRRMAIDLRGRTPTQAEQARCATQSFAEMADAFMASDEFVRTQRRAWAELAKYESLLVWGRDLDDLDQLVGGLYRDEVAYDDFVRAYVVHPAFYALHPGDAWTANVFSIFLGRPARQDELTAARPLTLAWQARAFAGGHVFWSWYQWQLGKGQSEAAATSSALVQAYNGAKVEWDSNLCACTPALLSPGCFSDVFGPYLELAPICNDLTAPRAAINVYRFAARTPTTDELCPDELTRRPECADRARGVDPVTFAPFVEVPELTPAMRAEWRKIGDALVGRQDLWEAAVDRELRKLLGWWQATFKHPESDLPEVRAVLVDLLRQGASVREVMQLILTSQLYVQPQQVPDGVDPLTAPPWVAGPAKLLAGEGWWASAVAAVGETPGTCDFRWGQSNTYEPRWTDPRLVESTAGSIDARYTTATPAWGHSIAAIQRLGGCTGDSKRAEISNVGLAFAQANIARELCALATTVTPAGWSGDLAQAATHLVSRAWARAPLPGEIDAMVAEMTACLDAGTCPTAEVAARWLCVRLLDSAEFSTY